MALGTATIEMRSPEEHRERLHEQVKAARAVLVLWNGGDGRIAAQRMALLDADDDTTMYAAGPLDATHVTALVRDPRVRVMVVVVSGDALALFDAEATIVRDRDGSAARGSGARGSEGCGSGTRVGRRGDAEIADTVLVLAPIEGVYWDGRERQVYQYRLPRSSGERESAEVVIEA